MSRQRATEAPAVRLVDRVLRDAVRHKASDVHFEPYEEDLRIRYRVDGVLREVLRPPAKLGPALTSRLKILSELNIAERRVPQDGRTQILIGGKQIDLRISTLPTVFGERVVARILDTESLRLDLGSLGMEDRAHSVFSEAIERPSGMVLATGPTGSGKTTTLYAALRHLNTPGVNIMTAEDPVEYSLPGVSQVQVRADVGLTFAATLRAFLRQDPNVLMVGEIRDGETADIAVKAALTGHLVLSTLHTTDAASAVTRLLDMGVQAFNVAPALSVISAQRLVRRICTECRVKRQYPADFLRKIGLNHLLRDGTALWGGRGCVACEGSGYSGRQGLYEVLRVTGEIRQLLLDGAPVEAIAREAVSDGMLTLRDDGLRRVREGIVSLDEVLRRTPVYPWEGRVPGGSTQAKAPRLVG